MNDLQELLKDLKDIHEPAAISAWPPAIGWWILPVIVFLLVLIIIKIIRTKRRPNYKKIALVELKNIETNYQIQKNSHETTGEIALLIRKAMVAKYGNQQVAGMIDGEWLNKLDTISRTSLFSNGPGQVLVTVPYAKESNVDVQALFNATKKLLSHL